MMLKSLLRLCLLLALTPALHPAPSLAHEVLPSIGDFQRNGDTLAVDIRTNLEGIIAGIDLTATANTDAAPQAASYDSLHALPPAELQARFAQHWPSMATGITLRIDGIDQPLTLTGVVIPETIDAALPRTSTISFTAPLPANAQTVQIGWSAAYGALVIRQNGVENPYDGYLEAGALSAPISLTGGDRMTATEAFIAYIPVGFDHIVPKGLDHILFVLGLFFLSTQLRPLLWQISAFTLAHTVTLGLGALGYVTLPAAIVEPVIAASIVFVAVENILTPGLSRSRPFVVFGFGLLHGLGFASVLQDFGLPQDGFIPALIGFNIGVELGQLAVIAAAFLLVGLWFGKRPWYRARIGIPASGAIAAVGAYWFVERIVA